MAIPRVIPIKYIPDYYTRFIGRCKDGRQFMAFVVATLPEPMPRDWKRHKRWYAVLHTFDRRGNHLDTVACFAGVAADGELAVCERAGEERTKMLDGPGDYTLCDVRVKLFSVQIDGSVFGLTDTSDPERGESVTLWPNDFFFHPPWDGNYDT